MLALPYRSNLHPIIILFVPSAAWIIKCLPPFHKRERFSAQLKKNAFSSYDIHHNYVLSISWCIKLNPLPWWYMILSFLSPKVLLVIKLIHMYSRNLQYQITETNLLTYLMSRNFNEICKQLIKNKMSDKTILQIKRRL